MGMKKQGYLGTNDKLHPPAGPLSKIRFAGFLSIGGVFRGAYACLLSVSGRPHQGIVNDPPYLTSVVKPLQLLLFGIFCQAVRQLCVTVRPPNWHVCACACFFETYKLHCSLNSGPFGTSTLFFPESV